MEQVTVLEMNNETRKHYPTLYSILRSVNLKINQFLLCIAGISLILGMLLVVLNAMIRSVYVPIPGTVEMVGWFTAVATAFAIGNAQINQSHVYIDLLFNKFSLRWKKAVNFFVMLVSCAFFIVLGWQMMKYGLSIKSQGLVSETLRLPFYPFVLLVSLGNTGLISTLLIQSIEPFFKEKTNGS